jgi:hypothetical protein
MVRIARAAENSVGGADAGVGAGGAIDVTLIATASPSTSTVAEAYAQ